MSGSIGHLVVEITVYIFVLTPSVLISNVAMVIGCQLTSLEEVFSYFVKQRGLLLCWILLTSYCLTRY